MIICWQRGWVAKLELLLHLNNQTMDADGCKLLDTEHDGRRLVLSYSPKLASKQRCAKMIDNCRRSWVKV